MGENAIVLDFVVKPFLIRILAMSHKETAVTDQDFGFVQFAWVSKLNDSIKWKQIEILNQPMPTQFGKQTYN